MIKAIFFDIDGTLLDSSGHAAQSTKKALELVNKKGILVGVATGRGPYRLEKQIDHLEMDIYVTYNGQLVYSPKRTLFAQSFAPETLTQLMNFAEKNQRQMMFGTRYKVLGSRLLRFAQSRMAQKLFRLLPKWFPVVAFRKMVSVIKKIARPTRFNVETILKTPIYQVVMLSPMGELARLKKEFPDCHFTRSNKLTVDIIPKGGSKILGIKKITEPFGISISEVMVFGDSWNDLEMIQEAGIGVAMGNAPREVQKKADYVTGSNDQDGIYQAFVHFGLIDEPEQFLPPKI
ncbi:Cof-type HAD-IIB family hydrolase [Enterococcus timonensis]|uniref:Cof-type HAD-IIB family hydrolase n=1 Tax=Enterococcus timonensis TaxID=1852364 RepID=UPI0008D8E5D2|nr:Cof-type HAD-IIB family hydrolase [Enterococcus timonensis]